MNSEGERRRQLVKEKFQAIISRYTCEYITSLKWVMKKSPWKEEHF